MELNQNLIWLIMLFITVTISILLHELSHAYVAKRNGVNVPFFQIGFGKELFTIKNIKIMSCPIGAGAAVDVNLDYPHPKYQIKMIKIFSSGILVNMLLLAIFSLTDTSIMFNQLMVEVNLLLIIQNVLPMKICGAKTDGLRVLHALSIINKSRKELVKC